MTDEQLRILNSPINVGHGNFLEPTLILTMRINVDHIISH